jgi:hypothetical protein
MVWWMTNHMPWPGWQPTRPAIAGYLRFWRLMEKKPPDANLDRLCVAILFGICVVLDRNAAGGPRMKANHLPKYSPLMWNDRANEWDERPSDVEEQTEMRRRKRRLCEDEAKSGACKRGKG